jgi:aconitate hydratase
VLPLQFKRGSSANSLKLTGREKFDIRGLDEHLKCGQEMTVVATADNGHVSEFPAVSRIDTPVEIEYYRNGGILHRVLRQMLKA